MSWDATDEETWERWEAERLARRAAEAGARGAGRGDVAGEKDAARSSGCEALHPAYGLYDRYSHEED